MRVLSILRTCAFAWATLTWSLQGAAQEISKAECAEAYEQAQERRVAGKLRSSREALVVCANRECPAFVQADCAQWLGEVEREVPSIVIAAKDASGNDAVEIKVLVDGEVVAEALDGTAIDLDPGMHVIRFEAPGEPAVEKKLVINQGEKNRFIEVTFAPEGSNSAAPVAGDAAVEAPPSRTDLPDPERDTGEPGPLRPYAYAAGGVGAAGMLGFAVFALMGRSEEDDLRDTCGRTSSCSQEDVDAAHMKYVLADVSLGVGIAGLGTAVALYLLSEPKRQNASVRKTPWVTVDVRALPGGGAGTLSGRF